MRRLLSLFMAAALVTLPVGAMIRRTEQKRMLARLKELGWGLGESEKLYNFYYAHWPSRG